MLLQFFLVTNFFLGFYITCNQLPDYGGEQENVMRRLHVLNTRSWKNVETPAWMEENAFTVLLWIVKQLSENGNVIDKEDWFFYRYVNERVPITVKRNICLFLQADCLGDPKTKSVTRVSFFLLYFPFSLGKTIDPVRRVE